MDVLLVVSIDPDAATTRQIGTLLVARQLAARVNLVAAPTLASTSERIA